VADRRTRRLAPPMGDGRTRPTTFDTLYPLEIRERVTAEAATTPTTGWERLATLAGTQPPHPAAPTRAEMAATRHLTAIQTFQIRCHRLPAVGHAELLQEPILVTRHGWGRATPAGWVFPFNWGCFTAESIDPVRTPATGCRRGHRSPGRCKNASCGCSITPETLDGN